MEMSPIPKTAPFAEEEIDLLNRVVGTASPIQRAWLAGFLAGLDASSGGGALAIQPDVLLLDECLSNHCLCERVRKFGKARR